MNKKHKVILLTLPEIHHVLGLLRHESFYYGNREQHERRRQRIINQLRHHIEASDRRTKNA
jgi:hypothetical protein